MEAPGWVRSTLAWVGDVEWPGGDEDACDAQADEWAALAQRMEKLKEHAINARERAFQGFIAGDYRDDQLAPNFRNAISQIEGQIENYKYLEDSLRAHAKNIRDTKCKFKKVIGRFLAENALALAGGWLTGLVLKLALRAVLKKVLSEAVQVAMSAAEKSAPKLSDFAKALPSPAAKVVAPVLNVVETAVIGAGGITIGDALGQGLNIAMGGPDRTTGEKQTSFNWGELGRSARDGALMGGIAGPLSRTPILNTGKKIFDVPQKIVRNLGVNTAAVAGAEYVTTGHVNLADALRAGVTGTLMDPISMKHAFSCL